MNYSFAISIVVYRPNPKKLNILLKKILDLRNKSLIFLIDNSENKFKFDFPSSKNVIYIKNKKNLGYGAANNIAIRKCYENFIEKLFVINYDIDFKKNVFKEMVDFLMLNKNIGLMMPKILYPNNKKQFLPKLQPNSFSIIKRKIFQLTKIFFKDFVDKFEGRELDDKSNYIVKNLSGCFLLFNLKLMKNRCFFDERFFLYMEDYDLCRRLTKKYNLVLYNKPVVYHSYRSGANQNIKLFFLFLRSYIKFFNKWGWLNSNYNDIQNKIIKLD